MSNINLIPDALIVDVMRYSLPGSIDGLKNISMRFKTILADKAMWKSRECKPLESHNIVYGSSIGTTELLIRASNINRSCASCGSNLYIRRHKFYDVNLCPPCSRRGDFQTGGFKSVCAEYFLKPNDVMGNKSILKVANGPNYSVLLHRVKRVAELKYPDGLLEEKRILRHEAYMALETRKRDCRDARSDSLRRFFFQKASSVPGRVHPALRNDTGYGLLFILINGLDVGSLIFGDLFDLKITTNADPRRVAEDIKDFACMISFLKKRDILDDSFLLKPEYMEAMDPRYIFRKYIRGDGLHFYESIIEYIECNTAYLRRVSRVDEHLSTYNLSALERRQICLASCAEDGVNFDPSDFSEFIHTGTGNPVAIARKVRKDKFLNENNMFFHIHSFINMGYCPGYSTRLARERVLRMTLGFPPMLELMIVDLMTPVDQRKKRRILQPVGSLRW